MEGCDAVAVFGVDRWRFASWTWGSWIMDLCCSLSRRAAESGGDVKCGIARKRQAPWKEGQPADRVWTWTRDLD